MGERDPLDDIRHMAAQLCRKPRSRTSAFTFERPTDWNPGKVRDPEDNEPFTDAGAWEFVAQQLVAGEPITEIALEKPPGKRGYVMKLDVGGATRIYVKFELGSGKIFGRSFHYSRPEDRER